MIMSEKDREIELNDGRAELEKALDLVHQLTDEGLKLLEDAIRDEVEDRRREKKMKTYYTDSPRSAYSCSLIVVKAEDKQTAIKLIVDEIFGSEDQNTPWVIEEIENIKKTIKELGDHEVIYSCDGD